MIHYTKTPEILEIAEKIYHWDYGVNRPSYGNQRTSNDYYQIINPRGWKMADGSMVVLNDAELTMALGLAKQRAMAECTCVQPLGVDAASQESCEVHGC